MTEVNPLQAKVWLLLVHSYSFPTLSRNILREVCMYLGGRKLLRWIYNYSLHLYDLHTKKGSVVILPHYFDVSWVFCSIENEFLLAVYYFDAFTINLNSFEISPAGRLNTYREWPGMGWAAPYVYVFGGGSPAITSCEKLQWGTGVWRAIGDMKGPKSCFTPCRVRDEFYLCCFNKAGKPFEAFHLTTETFRDLPVTYRSQHYSSVTCQVGDSLYIVGNEEILLQWKLGQMQLEQPVKRFNCSGEELGLSSIPPVSLGRKIYWVCNGSGRLICLDLDTELIEVLTK